MKMYVGNLSFETTENDLQDLFEQHGTVSEVHLMMDRFTGKSRGFAFVTMNDGAQANAAVGALNGKELNVRAKSGRVLMAAAAAAAGSVTSRAFAGRTSR